MSLRVVKLGGSVLRSPESFELVAEIMKMYSRPTVAVLSAMAGVTDLLYSQVEQIRQGHDPASVHAQLRGMHERALLELIVEVRPRRKAVDALRQEMQRLQVLYTRLDAPKDDRGASVDKILSWGERLAVCVAAAVLRDRGIDCQRAYPESLGLIARETLSGPRISLQSEAEALRGQLAAPAVHLVPGFYGVRPDGSPVLLGRGGSDYSAACLAHFLEADSLDLWKGVAGFRTADPQEVSGTRRISHLSYAQAAELCYSGSEILHPATVEPVSRKEIPIRIFGCPPGPHSMIPDTAIGGYGATRDTAIKGVASTDRCGVVRMYGTDVGFEPGILSVISQGLGQKGINIRSVLTSQTCISFIFRPEDVGEAAGIIKQIAPPEVCTVQTETAVALVTIVGPSVGVDPAVLARILDAAGRCAGEITMVCAGASESAINLITSEAARREVLQAVHGEFFSQKGAECDGQQDI